MSGSNTRPLYFPETEQAIREHFKGRNSAGLRRRLRDEAYTGWIGNFSDVALTIWGGESLAEVRRVHRAEMVEQGLADARGYPLYEIGADEDGVPVAYLDQKVETH